MTSNDIDATRITLSLNELRLPAIKARDFGSLAAFCRTGRSTGLARGPSAQRSGGTRTGRT
jgi:hypothetical protein